MLLPWIIISARWLVSRLHRVFPWRDSHSIVYSPLVTSLGQRPMAFI